MSECQLYINSGAYRENMNGFKTTMPDKYEKERYTSLKNGVNNFIYTVEDIRNTYKKENIRFKKIKDGPLMIYIDKVKYYCLWINGWKSYKEKTRKQSQRKLNEYIEALTEV